MRTATSKRLTWSSAPKARDSLSRSARRKGRSSRRAPWSEPSIRPIWASSGPSSQPSVRPTPRASTRWTSRWVSLQAQRLAAGAQRDAARAVRASLDAQIDVARRAYERTKRLFDQQAATAQQLDQAERDFRVLEEQIAAQDEQIAAQEHQIAAQAQPDRRDARAAQDGARSSGDGRRPDCTRHRARPQERRAQSDWRAPSWRRTPRRVRWYSRASRSTRSPISDPSKSARTSANVSYPPCIWDRRSRSRGRRRGPAVASGTVSWVSSQAEFTPTPIQTREERADLVYAIKIRVANDRRPAQDRHAGGRPLRRRRQAARQVTA